ncbi:zinc finger CCHC domain-containing protein 14 isoform X1 [Hemibagrus wyckioides]|uniref:zinc finger CCHC domain-containing protein 14 isoform X1 n=1 Tax=Hemibagrus wyckioides TaxID=337641 RepID=UPI00266D6F3D|nr:zinc finger CCHC domain-containing protein 14 isoform X1 [Hemibagrus wyckioides]
MVENRCCLKREEVYRWFSGLSSAQRAEFLCGLLDLCVPVELRFLGSCLEDLARKDYHSLRDAEIKANNPADLALLANMTDEVVRSKLLVSLALLGSDNRAAAGVLFRTLTHVDTIIHDYGLRLSDGRTGEQFLLLFTMAANHPAFSFHQKQVLRQLLAQIQEILQSSGSDTAHGGNTGSPAVPTSMPTYISAPAHLTCCTKTVPREVTTGPVDDGVGSEVMSPTPAPTCQEPPIKMHAGKPGKVRVERIELKGVTHKVDSSTEYTLEVVWSDSTLSVISKTSQEVMELVSQLSQLFPDDCLEKFLPQPGVEPHDLDLRCLSSLPAHVLRHERVRLFCTSSSPQPTSSTNLSCLLQYRGANRAVCGVASVQPVVNVLAPMPQPSPAHLPPPPILPLHPSLAVPTIGETNSPQQQTAPHPQQQQPHPPSPEQNGILDWLRKLRLHKYYPVFKQLTMEEFLALTEEDLNKYDLTQGAKKKLKTQLELQKEKLHEKRYTMSQFPVSCGGVARVTPSTYNGPITHTSSSSNTELRVEVEAGSLSSLRDSSSSSGYSSSPSSPMTPLKETHRRTDVECVEKDRVCFLLSTAGSGPSRPTAQVLPVQNDPSVCPSHTSVTLPSIPLLAPGRGLGSASRKPRPPLLCTAMGVEAPPPGHQEVETCTALTVTSNALHHVSHPTLHFQVSATPGHARLSQYPNSASSSSSSSFSSSSSSFSFSSSSKPTFSPISAVPMAAVSGNTYSPNSASIVAPPTTSPVTTETACYGSAQSNGTTPCVCSSCGCSGKCGSFYFPHPFSGTSLFTFGPLLHFSPLLAGSGSASPFSYPIVAPPLYSSSLSHDSQQNLVLPPMQGFLGGGTNTYQPYGMMGNGGTGQKKVGSVSCYNCGLSGHRAHDCKQPPMDSAQQGMFRLKYSPQSDSQDSGD